MDRASLANAAEGTRHVFLRDMLLAAHIGVYASEHGTTQRIRVNVDFAVDDPEAVRPNGIGRDALDRVVDYSGVAETVRAIVSARHVQLVETLAERLAAGCLASDRRIRSVRVRVEKLDIMPDGASAGVEVERLRR